MMNIRRAGAMLLMAVLSSVCPLTAQSLSGNFVGLVTDQPAAVAPNAAIDFVDTQRGSTKTVHTGPDGAFALPYMLPGEYRVRVHIEGFKAWERSGVRLTLGSTVRVDIKLELGAVTETVTVSQQAPLLQADSVEVQHTIDNRTLEDMPVLGRNYTTALLLIPGAGVPANYWAPENSYGPANTMGHQDTPVNGMLYTANKLSDGWSGQ